MKCLVHIDSDQEDRRAVLGICWAVSGLLLLVPCIIVVNYIKVWEFHHRSIFVVHCSLIRQKNPNIVSKVGFWW